MVMQGHRNLDQSLQEFLLRVGCGPPYVLQSFMGLKELVAIEKLQAARVSAEIHHLIVAQGERTGSVAKYT